MAGPHTCRITFCKPLTRVTETLRGLRSGISILVEHGGRPPNIMSPSARIKLVKWTRPDCFGRDDDFTRLGAGTSHKHHE